MALHQPAILALDQGSSHSRAILFDACGVVIARAEAPLRTYHPHPGWVEHKAEELLKGVFTAFRHALHQGGITPVALGIANQRSTVICWDKKSGKALSPAISWQDTRTAETIHQKIVPDIINRTGLPLTPYYAATKLSWLLSDLRRKGVAMRNLLCGTVNTFLIWHLTGGGHKTDPTNAARMLLYNLDRQEWDDDLLRHFKIPRHILPEIQPTQSDFGKAVIDQYRIPITCSIGDQQASLAGLGGHSDGLAEGLANINYGTGGFFLVNTGMRRLPIPGLLTSVAWSEKGKTAYVTEGTVNAVGSLFHWLCQLGLLRSEKAINAACARSKERLFFLPALFGLGAPHWDTDTKTALLGLTAASRREDIIRGAVEGVAFLMNDIYEAIQREISIKKIVASGGGSRIHRLVQFQADLFGKPIEVTDDPESTIRGAALFAGLQAQVTDRESFFFPQRARKISPALGRAQRADLISRWKKTVSLARDWMN